MTNRWLYTILLVSLSLIGLMYLETYLLPRGQRKEVVTDEATYNQRTRAGGRSVNRTVSTNAHRYDVGPVFYSDANPGDTITVCYALLTHAPEEMILDKPDSRATYKEGFLQYGGGLFYTGLTLAGILAMLPMVPRISNEAGKRNLVLALLVCALLNLLCYLNLF